MSALRFAQTPVSYDLAFPARGYRLACSGRRAEGCGPCLSGSCTWLGTTTTGRSKPSLDAGIQCRWK
jgi:hypothetical protein